MVNALYGRRVPNSHAYMPARRGRSIARSVSQRPHTRSVGQFAASQAMTSQMQTKPVPQISFTCPVCSHRAKHAVQVTRGRHVGTFWRAHFICEKCHRIAYCANELALGALLGILLAAFAISFGSTLLEGQLGLDQWLSVPITTLLGIPLLWLTCRIVSRHLAQWEPVR